MIFIATHWTNVSNTSVTVYRNCEHVQLQFNGVQIPIASEQHDSSHLVRPPVIFHVGRYTPGRLDATGFTKGKPVARAHHLNSRIDLSGQPVSRNDLVFAYAYVCDENDTMLPYANGWVTFSLVNAGGSVTLIGDNRVRAEAGIAIILLKTSNRKAAHSMVLVARASSIEDHEARHEWTIS